MFPHLGRPLVQVLLRLAQIGYLKDMNVERRNDVLRLVLFWMVGVNNHKKASEIAYKVIKDRIEENNQVGKAIHDELIVKQVATRVIPPSLIELRSGLAKSTDGSTTLCCDSRFTPVGVDEAEHKHVYDFYRRWWRPWTYHHPMLLWLQREYVATQIGGDPMAGREEDTPYDYDHILPSSHWADWRGPNGCPPSFAGGEIGIVGNGIGNLRVWDSSNNRSDGDEAPKYKLGLTPKPGKGDSPEEHPSTMEELLRWSAIPNCDEHINNWRGCSLGIDGEKRTWNPERTVAFQKAVELRTFALYESFYNELAFSEWPENLPDTKE
jgi:hypothetical protein